jgi:hypothetical protein
MKKNYFQDPYEHISSTTSRAPAVPIERKELWTDKRTGAQYSVPARPANPADADFSDSFKLAESRYRSIMGLNETFHERPVDDPFAEDRLESEAMPMHHEIEERARERARFDTQQSERFKATTEPAESEIVDHGEFTVNSRGQIRDKPMNTIGPFGTEEKRAESKFTKDDSEDIKRREQNDRAQISNPQRPDALEAKIGEHRGLQNALANAYRSLFGVNFADHVITRPANDAKTRSDKPSVSHAIIEAGFTKPWAPAKPADLGRDGKKPDAVVLSVGQRAIATLMKGPMKSELPDLPKAEREALATALGRTILHALTRAPESEKDRTQSEQKTRDDLKSSMMNALSPEILRGLVPAEMIDSISKTESKSERLSPPAQKALDIPARRPNTDLKEGHSSRYDETETREPKPNSEFGIFRKPKKTLFDFVDASAR